MSEFFRKLLPITISVGLTTASYAIPSESLFTSAEHITIGNHVNLRFSAQDPGQSNTKLALPNNLQLSYGEILTLADFYGEPDKPISLGQSEYEQRARFMQAFHSLALEAKSVNEAQAILAVGQEEQSLINQAIEKNEPIESVYANIGHRFDIKINCITGGGCTEATWLVNQGRFLKLANMDYDHFGDNALSAYQIGHRIALETAANAGSTQDKQKLAFAYAINAFASHFLTDRFSAGHIRTPRIELPAYTTPATIGSILASYMHAEENYYGLHVHNPRGDQWIAYGDKSYFKPQTARQRELIDEAVQQSANHIFAAYLSGQADYVDQETINLIPYPNESANHNQSDISPLFYWDQQTKKLYRRTHMPAPFDRNWKTNWWGWSTLLELQAERGLGKIQQARLAQSDLREQALKEGLITEPSLVGYVRAVSLKGRS